MNIVLVASRSTETMDALRDMLGEEYDLYHASRLPEVFSALAGRPTDLIFVDSRLADCEGKHAVQEIAAEYPQVNIIYLSMGKNGKETSLREVDNAFACLSKPLDREMVRLMTEKATERSKLSRKIEYLASLVERTGREEDFRRAADWPSSEPRSGAFTSLGRSMVRKLLKSLSPITNLDKLLGMFADSVRELFGSNNVAVFTWNHEKARYVAGAWQGVDEGLAVVCSFNSRHGMVRWLTEHQQLLTRDKLRNSFPRASAADVGTDMDALRAEVIMPLLQRGNLIGFLSMGKKMTGRTYEEQDLELLAVIGECASGAIGTALLHRELSSQKATTDAVLKNIACGIISVDTEASILSMNNFAQNMLEVNVGEPVGKSVQKLGSVLADMVIRTIKENEVFLNRPYRDGATEKTFAVSTCKLLDDDSNLIGAILFFIPIQEEEEEEEQQTEEESLLEGNAFSAFCGQIADRVKNPLSSIKTFSQLLPEKFDDEEFRQKFSEIVGRAVERINSLVDGLIGYAAAGPLDLSPTNITAVMENALASLRGNLHKRKLRLDAPGSDKPAMALADGRLIRSAFLNILENSIESTPEDGTITISIRETSYGKVRRRKPSVLVVDSFEMGCEGNGMLDNEAVLEAEIHDAGTGIPHEEMANLVKPFYTTKEQKAGLGLAIAERIVSRHHGRMEIESKEGKGTTVRITLPLKGNSD